MNQFEALLLVLGIILLLIIASTPLLETGNFERITGKALKPIKELTQENKSSEKNIDFLEKFKEYLKEDHF